MAAVSDAVFRTRRVARPAALAGALGLAATALGATFAPARAMASYLAAFAYWVSAALGALVFLMIGYAVRGKWPVVMRRATEAVAGTLPLLALLALPLLFGARRLYPWLMPLHDAELAAIVAKKRAYLNLPFFALRAAIYFASWIAAAGLLGRWSAERDRASPDAELGDDAQARERTLSSAMLPLVGLTLTFAAFDWLMSLDPSWYSSVFGLYFYAGGQVAGLALVIAVVFAAQRAGLYRELTPFHYHALGRVLFAFVIVWAYLGYFQALLIRIANKPEELSFFIRRTAGGWMGVVWLLALGHFVVPFVALLSRRLKHRPRAMAIVAGWLLVMHYLDAYWLVLPAVQAEHALPHWLDLAAFLGVGGATVAFGAWRLHGRPSFPLTDPFLAEGLRYRSPT